MTDQLTHYAERDPSDLEPYFSQHVLAMTDEGLHSKAAIALELAYRDHKIAELEKDLERERLRLAACGVAALGYFDGCADEYKSASLTDTLKMYEELSRLRQVVEAAMKLSSPNVTGSDWLKDRLQGIIDEATALAGAEKGNLLIMIIRFKDVINQLNKENERLKDLIRKFALQADDL